MDAHTREATREAKCSPPLRRGVRRPPHEALKRDGAKDGGVGVYVLSRQQLQRWWYVDELSATELQEKYRSECGVYAHRSNLVRWLKAWPFPNILYVLFFVESSPFVESRYQLSGFPCEVHPIIIRK